MTLAGMYGARDYGTRCGVVSSVMGWAGAKALSHDTTIPNALISDSHKQSVNYGYHMLAGNSGLFYYLIEYLGEFLLKVLEVLEVWKVLEECSSKADLIEIKCCIEDPCRDKSVTSGIRASRLEAMANENEKIGASGSAIVDENRGRDDMRQNPKKRGTSKDVMASLDQRVTSVKTSMAELKNQVEGLEGLDSISTEYEEGLSISLTYSSWRLKRELPRLKRSFMGEIMTLERVLEKGLHTSPKNH
ncbi:hypothetical protein Tco_0011703 [Tanacetum coccineum]